MCASGYPPLVDPKSHPYYVPPRDPAEGDISAGMVGRMDVEHAPWSLLMGTMYFEDLNVGDSWTSAEHRVDHEEMLVYNRTNDPWPIHIDPAEAARSPFGGLIASGGYTISLMYRLSHQIVNQPDRAWAFLGGFDWHVKFVEPVRSGDRLHERITILEKRLSSKPGRGLVKHLIEVMNDRKHVALSIESTILIATSPR